MPHYFGPYSNWANSPQVLTDAVVSITPTGPPAAGAQATATVDPVTGAVTAITVTNPGIGYTANPDVVDHRAPAPLAHGDGRNRDRCRVEHRLSQRRRVASSTLRSRSLHPLPAPRATAIASGGVDSITLLNGGRGYSINPIVVIGQPNLTNRRRSSGRAGNSHGHDERHGSGHGNIDCDPGTGYTSAPTITINDGLLPPVTQPPAQPAIAATASSTILVDEVDITAGGAGYLTAPAPAVTILDLEPNPLDSHRPGCRRGGNDLQRCERNHCHQRWQRLSDAWHREVRRHTRRPRRHSGRPRTTWAITSRLQFLTPRSIPARTTTKSAWFSTATSSPAIFRRHSSVATCSSSQRTSSPTTPASATTQC